MVLHAETADPAERVAEDLLAIVTVFAARAHGMRRYQRTLEKELAGDGAKEALLRQEQATKERNAAEKKQATKEANAKLSADEKQTNKVLAKQERAAKAAANKQDRAAKAKAKAAARPTRLQEKGAKQRLAFERAEPAMKIGFTASQRADYAALQLAGDRAAQQAFWGDWVKWTKWWANQRDSDAACALMRHDPLRWAAVEAGRADKKQTAALLAAWLREARRLSGAKKDTPALNAQAQARRRNRRRECRRRPK